MQRVDLRPALVLRLTRAAAVEDTLNYYAFPEEQSARAHSAQVRRRTRVVSAFSDCQSALNLAAARLWHTPGTCGAKRYLNIELLKNQQMRGAISA
jgi:hypothetical protein